jgi:hypothetical protein
MNKRSIGDLTDHERAGLLALPGHRRPDQAAPALSGMIPVAQD